MMFWRIFRLELRVAFRHSAEIANPLWFFLIVITLFPLSIGPEPQTAGAYCTGHYLGCRAAFILAGTRATVP
ncbi:heme exporter protein B [Escherichia coli]|nr:heme exporter protein B [Escherichia coli]